MWQATWRTSSTFSRQPFSFLASWCQQESELAPRSDFNKSNALSWCVMLPRNSPTHQSRFWNSPGRSHNHAVPTGSWQNPSTATAVKLFSCLWNFRKLRSSSSYLCAGVRWGTVPLQGGQRRRVVAEDEEEHCCVSVSVEDTHYSLYNAFLQGRSCPFPHNFANENRESLQSGWKCGHETSVEDDGLEKDTQQSREAVEGCLNVEGTTGHGSGLRQPQPCSVLAGRTSQKPVGDFWAVLPSGLPHRPQL